jgi:hypothetical protein
MPRTLRGTGVVRHGSAHDARPLTRTGSARTAGNSTRAFCCRSARPCSSSCPSCSPVPFTYAARPCCQCHCTLARCILRGGTFSFASTVARLHVPSSGGGTPTRRATGSLQAACRAPALRPSPRPCTYVSDAPAGRPHALQAAAAAGNAAGSHWNSFAKPALGQFEPMNLRAQASSGRSRAWHTPNDTARHGGRRMSARNGEMRSGVAALAAMHFTASVCRRKAWTACVHIRCGALSGTHCGDGARAYPNDRRRQMVCVDHAQCP